MYIAINAQAAVKSGEIVFETKPVSVEGCTYEFSQQNTTLPTSQDDSLGFQLYHISYLYFSVLGTLITIIVSTIVSMFMGFRNPTEIEPKLLAPCLRKYFKRKQEYEIVKEKYTVTHEFIEQNN